MSFHENDASPTMKGICKFAVCKNERNFNASDGISLSTRSALRLFFSHSVVLNFYNTRFFKKPQNHPFEKI